MTERNCKNCGQCFEQYRTTQNLCDDCAYLKLQTSTRKYVRKAIKHKGKVTKQWLDVDRPKWIKNHPPNQYGYWECYLQISKRCRRWISIEYLTLDHVKPRGSNPSKRRKQQNFKPACSYCNSLKGSLSIARVKKLYPNSKIAKGSVESDYGI